MGLIEDTIVGSHWHVNVCIRRRRNVCVAVRRCDGIKQVICIQTCARANSNTQHAWLTTQITGHTSFSRDTSFATLLLKQCATCLTCLKHVAHKCTAQIDKEAHMQL